MIETRIIEARAPQERPTPSLLLFDANARPVAHSTDVDTKSLSESLRQMIETGLRRLERSSEPFLEIVDRNVVLRFVRLVGNGGYRAVFIERVAARPSVDALIAQASLSKREGEVLRLIVQALTSNEIARELGISVSTVVHHMKSIHRKTHCTRRSELIARAFAATEELHHGVAVGERFSVEPSTRLTR